MPPSWRAGLVNAFPIPDDKRKKRKGTKASSKHPDEPTQAITAGSSDATPAAATPPFPFLLLPPEIRTRIYHLILFPPPRLPTDPKPTTAATNSLALLRTSPLFHAETTHLLYTHTAFPLFHIQNFPPLPTPLLIPPRHRPLLKALHLRLGNSWSAPPKSWRVSKLLGRALPKFTSLTTLKVFVEMDPSEPMFEKYRVSESFYTDFAGMLLGDVLRAMPQVATVEAGGYAFVDIHGPLVRRVVQVTAVEGRRLVWSDENGWRERASRGAEEEKEAKPHTLELVSSLGRPELESLLLVDRCSA